MKRIFKVVDMLRKAESENEDSDEKTKEEV